MKKGLLGLAVLLVFGLVLVGCPTDPKEEDKMTKFEGSWENTDWTYRFEGSTIVATPQNPDDTEKPKWSGTFTTHITITATIQGQTMTFTNQYVFSDNDTKLVFTGSPPLGTFTKKQ